MNRRYLTLLLAAGMLVSPGCRLFRRNTVKAAPPVITSPPVSRTPAPEQPTVPPPPKVAEGPKPVVAPPKQIGQTPVPTPPPKPEPPKQKKSRRRAPVVAATPPPVVETPPQPVEQPAPVPQLTQLLSPTEQAAYNKAIDAAIERTRANLAKVPPQGMDENQKANLARARAFLQQAEEARTTDLPTAKHLADRAEILAVDLARNAK